VDSVGNLRPGCTHSREIPHRRDGVCRFHDEAALADGHREEAGARSHLQNLRSCRERESIHEVEGDLHPSLDAQAEGIAALVHVAP
jgi:hypothetical protein